MKITKQSYLVEINQYIIDQDRKVSPAEICRVFGIKESSPGWPITRGIIKKAKEVYEKNRISSKLA